jgi:hypothetical protein
LFFQIFHRILFSLHLRIAKAPNQPNHNAYHSRLRASSNNGFDSIMSSSTSFCSISDFSEIHAHIIKHNYDVFFWIEFIKITNSHDTFSGEIHKCHRFEKKHFFSIKISFRKQSFEFRIFEFTTFPRVRKILQKQKPDIMSSKRILWSWISESDDELHSKNIRDLVLLYEKVRKVEKKKFINFFSKSHRSILDFLR